MIIATSAPAGNQRGPLYMEQVLVLVVLVLVVFGGELRTRTLPGQADGDTIRCHFCYGGGFGRITDRILYYTASSD